MPALDEDQLKALNEKLSTLEVKINSVVRPRQILYALVLLNDILTKDQTQTIFDEAKTQLQTSLTALTTNVNNITLL